MQKSILGLLAVLVLFAGALTGASTQAFAVVDKKSLSATEKSAEDEKIKAEEKRSSADNTAAKDNSKSIGKTTKSTGKHNNKITSTKAKRGLQAVKSIPPTSLPPTSTDVGKMSDTQTAANEDSQKADSTTDKTTDNKSVSQTMKSMGKHNNKITSTKAKRGLQASKH